MGQTLSEIAEKLQGANKKVQLIYAFNASGKTRLSRAFRELIDPETEERDNGRRPKVLCYNAFTEDLFYRDNDLEYVFIDDPVSSLDENYLIQLAVDVADLIKRSDAVNGLKFIITTHSPLFFNVLFNELKKKTSCMLKRLEDGMFEPTEKNGDSNQSFSCHFYLKQTPEEAVAADKIERYHFTLLRNLYEKTSNFPGCPRWSELLPGDRQLYMNRIIQFTSHSTLSSETIAEPSPQEKQTVKLLLDHLRTNYSYWQEDAPDA